MKKHIAIITSFLLLFAAFDSVALLTSAKAASQISVYDSIATPGKKGETNSDSKTTNVGESGAPFFAEVPMPKALNQYKPKDIKGHWASTYLLHFLYSDVLKGYKVSDTEYVVKPDNKITRAEFVTLLVRTLGLTSDKPGKTFIDVSKDDWFYEYVSTANALGIVKGINSQEFAPNRNVQRDEMAVMIIRAFQNTLTLTDTKINFKDVPANWWAKPEIDQAVKAKIINGYSDNTFRPKAPATRAEAVKMLFVGLVAQSSNIPKDADLINTVLHKDNELLNTLQSLDFTSSSKIVKKYNIGFARVMGQYDLSLYEETINKTNYLLDFKLIGEPKVEVLAKSNSIATVQLSNVKQQILKLNNDKEIIDELNQKINNIIYLRKMSNGQWKIYYNMPEL